MTIKTIMVQLTPGIASTHVLAVAARVASRFDAHIVGVAACQPTPWIQSDGYLPGTFVEEDLKEIDAELAAARTEFEMAFPLPENAEWRSATVYQSVEDYVVHEAGSADLLLTRGLAPDNIELGRSTSPGSLVMQAGRPILVVPQAGAEFDFGHIVVAWKNTREARRAAADALPLLQLARKVSVLQIANEDERATIISQLAQVVGWLKSHDVAADAIFHPRGNGDDASQLNAEVMRLGSDLVVAGAYGHSRTREWVLGGVTRDVLLRAPYCTLLSH